MKKFPTSLIWLLSALLFYIIVSGNAFAAAPKITHQLIVFNQSPSLGRVASKVGAVKSGKSVSINIKPYKNYYATIVVDGSIVKTGRPSKSLKYKINMQSNHTVKVYFTIMGARFVLPEAAVSLGWSAPAYRDNGDELLFSDIRGYEIHYLSADTKFSDTVEITDGGITSTIVKLPQAGAYYFSIATVDINGEKSQMSEPVEIMVD